MQEVPALSRPDQHLRHGHQTTIQGVRGNSRAMRPASRPTSGDDGDDLRPIPADRELSSRTQAFSWRLIDVSRRSSILASSGSAAGMSDGPNARWCAGGPVGASGDHRRSRCRAPGMKATTPVDRGDELDFGAFDREDAGGFDPVSDARCGFHVSSMAPTGAWGLRQHFSPAPDMPSPVGHRPGDTDHGGDRALTLASVVNSACMKRSAPQSPLPAVPATRTDPLQGPSRRWPRTRPRLGDPAEEFQRDC